MFRFESAFAQTSMLLVVMGVVIAACFAIPQLKKRLPDGMILILAGIVATLVDGWGFAIRHWVEGSFYFLNLILTIVVRDGDGGHLQEQRNAGHPDPNADQALLQLPQRAAVVPDAHHHVPGDGDRLRAGLRAHHRGHDRPHPDEDGDPAHLDGGHPGHGLHRRPAGAPGQRPHHDHLHQRLHAL